MAIIGILAAVALPAYNTYTTKAAYSEVINAVTPYKAAVEVCVLNNAISACGYGTNGGTPANGIPGTVATPAVAKVEVSGGTILVTPNAYKGIVATDTYQLAPTGGTNAGDQITAWTATCANAELC